MKALKLTALFAFAAFAFVSCSKKDDAPAPAPASTGSMTYEGTSFQMDKGYFYTEYDTSLKGNIAAAVLSSMDLTNDKDTIGHLIEFDFVNTALVARKYTYQDPTTGTYDYDNNFFQGTVYMNLGKKNEAVGYRVKSPSSFTVTKNGDNYKIDYDLTLSNGKAAKGTFSGAVKNLQ